MRYINFNLSNSKIFLICCIVFIAGIAGASFLPAEFMRNTLWWFAGIVGSAAVIILFWKNINLRIAALWALFLFLSFWRFAVGFNENTPDKIWHYNGQTMDVVGRVISEPAIKDKSVKYTVEALRLAGQKNISGKILISANLYPRYDYGDVLKITCALEAPEPFKGFAYDRYLGRFDVYSVCYYPQVSLLETGKGSWFYTNIFRLKNKLLETVDYGLAEPEASLAKTMMLGDRKGIPKDMQAAFSQTGLSHIVAISGMHVSILSGLIMFALLSLGLWRRQAFYFAILFLALYILISGMPASAMRSGVMGFLVLWALNIGRLNKVTNSLFLSASILLFINPKLLRDDIGFQLSFLAVLGMVYVYPIIDRLLEKFKMPKFRGARDVLSMTMAAQVFTMPIIAVNFSLFSVIAPIANILVIWTQPFLMIFIIAAIFLSLIFKSLAFIFFLPAKILLLYTIWIADFLAGIPFAYFKIDHFWPGWFIAYYMLVLLVFIKNK